MIQIKMQLSTKKIQNLLCRFFEFHYLIISLTSNSPGFLILQATPTELWFVGGITYYRRCCIYDALDTNIFEGLLIINSTVLF